MKPEQLQRRLLELVGGADYRPMKPRQIAARLGLKKDQAAELKQLVKALVKRGVLAYASGHQVRLPGASDESLVTGTFRRMEAGHGYVRPNGGDRSQDIYIPASEARDAASGDVVLVRRMPDRGRRGRTQAAGQIVEILQRETHQFVGTYSERAGGGYVQVDGGVFREPIFVGDPGAKGARPGDKVVFEMVRFPTHVLDGEGVITEVLGPRGQPGLETVLILREFNLPEKFPEDVLEEARDVAARFDESLAGRTDFTGLTCITIDPVDARDFDDAVSLQALEHGHWLLGVHIADASHFVRSGGALDREARQRGTSVYLPDRVLPMLPEIISNSLASLQPDKVRYTRSVMIEFNAEGIPVHTAVHRSAIRSARRFTYEEVDDFLARPQRWRGKISDEVFELLQRMHHGAMVLRARRFRRGAIELTMQEIGLDYDQQGRVVGAHRVENTVSHQIIEEFMLAANEAVATLLDDRDWLFLRRVHPSPDPRKLRVLAEFVKELGLKADSLENRFEIQRLLEAVADRPEKAAVNYAVLRSMQRAHYSPATEGHYALATEQYCHFTSPIRRYPDLTVHRLLDHLHAKKPPKQDEAELVALGEHCSNRERRAEAAERELIKIKLLTYFEDRIGQQVHGIIVGAEQFGLFVQGVEIPVEGLVHVTTLADDYYQYDPNIHALVGRRSGRQYRLGDRVLVEVVRVDVDQRELDFRLVTAGWEPAFAPKAKVVRPPRGGKKPAKPARPAKSGGGKKKSRRR